MSMSNLIVREWIILVAMKNVLLFKVAVSECHFFNPLEFSQVYIGLDKIHRKLNLSVKILCARRTFGLCIIFLDLAIPSLVRLIVSNFTNI